MRSSQPKTIPEGIVTRIQMISLISPPFLRNVDHLTIISTIQLTPGMSSKRICTKRLCLLNHVIFNLLIIFIRNAAHCVQRPVSCA